MASDASPTSRALRCLDVLQDHPGITADRLGDELGVSSRAARRYVALLREAGIPIESERGPYGGYRVGRGLRLPPLRFSSAQALGLVMAVLDGHHQASDPDDLVGSALGTIIRSLPAAVAAQAEAVRRTAAAAPDRGAARPDPETVTVLVQACADRRQVCIDYRSEAGAAWEATVDPWAVVVRHGRWYLLCHNHRANALRAYRVDRVGSVTTLEKGFVPPDDLDPVGLLEEHLSAGWEHEVEVVVDAPVGSFWFPRALGRLEAVDDSHTRLTGSTSNPWMYAESLATLPVPYRIVGCDDVRAVAREVAERMLAATGR
ncbi:WYL domain-containing protein [Nocardioides sp. JQ2195]|uniref:helix-turn-helix transcriptional regulator n=1 Tax=Nocardioides sp. JQ2195 TaxID=2592334 RepID=UPI00143E8DE5|nr:WYL domain-containing protein [Nocardioides sp. JQ2195]QIX28401.1 WYL domain-containing protein [Nocardioides sp. JQ2195]